MGVTQKTAVLEAVAFSAAFLCGSHCTRRMCVSEVMSGGGGGNLDLPWRRGEKDPPPTLSPPYAPQRPIPHRMVHSIMHHHHNLALLTKKKISTAEVFLLHLAEKRKDSAESLKKKKLERLSMNKT